jgi:hypothetical protein
VGLGKLIAESQDRDPKPQRALLCFPHQGEGWLLCFKGEVIQYEYDVVGSTLLDVQESDIAVGVKITHGLVIIDFTLRYVGGGYDAYQGDYDDPEPVFELKSERRPNEAETRLIVEGDWEGLRKLWSDIDEEKDPTGLACPHDELFGLTDQPTTCPKCGSRTDFIDVDLGTDEWHQHHKCLSDTCGFEFAAEEF